MDAVKSKTKAILTNFNFTIQSKKQVRTISVYSPYKQFVSEAFEFKSDFGTHTVKLINDLKHFQTYYRDLKMFFVFDTRFYSLNTGNINYYNELVKNVPNLTRQQVQDLITNSFTKKKSNC